MRSCAREVGLQAQRDWQHAAAARRRRQGNTFTRIPYKLNRQKNTLKYAHLSVYKKFRALIISFIVLSAFFTTPSF